MNFSAFFLLEAKTPQPMQPAQRSLNHLASAAQVLLAFSVTSGYAWGDASQPQPLLVVAIVIAFVSVQLGWAFSGSACQAKYLRQRQYRRLQQLRVMNVSRRQLRCQGQAALVDDGVMLATELSTVHGVGAGVIPAEGGRSASRVDAGAFPFDLVMLA